MSELPVTVIIPTYNRFDYLKKALLSVQKQTVPCREIIVVDDGSTDLTKDFVLQSAKADKRIRYFYKQNNGPAAARNLGIQESCSDFIAFLDSDDHWHKNKLKTQYSALFNSSDHLISHTYETWFRRGVHLNQKKIHIPRNGYIFDHCLQICGVGMSTVMVKKELFERVGYFNEDMPCCEDYDFWLRVSCHYDFLLIPERLTIKEGGREDQVSYQYRVGMDKLRINSLIRLIESDKLNSVQKMLAVREVVKKARIYGNGCVKHKNFHEGEEYLQIAENYLNKLEDNA